MNAQVEQLAALYRHDEVVQLRVPPQAVSAEQSVLGGLMLRPEAWPLVSDLLADEDFYRRDHQLIWRAIAELAGAGKPFDAVTLGDWFDAKGQAELVAGGSYLVELATTTPSAANIAAYAEIVGEKSRLRKMIGLGTDLVNDGFRPEGRTFAEILSGAQARMVELQPAQRGGLQQVKESLGGWYDRFIERYENNRKMTGLPTPWAEFNRVTHGLQPATLYLIAARPSMGKSVAGLSLALFSALRGKTTGFFSLEMSRDDCHNRNMASLGNVPHDFLVAPSKEDDRQDIYSGRMAEAMRRILPSPLFIDDTPALTVRQFEARARRMHQRNPLDLLVVDHIHDFAIDPKLARFEYGAIAQACKNLAKEWHIPVIALAQLNRNVTGRGDKRPTLADLRESGELEQKGDVIVFLHREDYYDENTHLKGVLEMHFAKGRNLRAGERITLRHRFDEMRIEDWDGDFPQEPKREPASHAGIGRR